MKILTLVFPLFLFTHSLAKAERTFARPLPKSDVRPNTSEKRGTRWVPKLDNDEVKNLEFEIMGVTQKLTLEESAEIHKAVEELSTGKIHPAFFLSKSRVIFHGKHSFTLLFGQNGAKQKIDYFPKPQQEELNNQFLDHAAAVLTTPKFEGLRMTSF